MPAAKPGEGSLLTLLPLDPEPDAEKRFAQQPTQVAAPRPVPPPAAPPMKSQIGAAPARPSVLGTSKLSPAAKVPPKPSIGPGAGLPRPEPRTAVGKSVAPSTLSASLNQRTSNSVVGPLPKSGLGAPLRPGAAPLPPSPTSGRSVAAPGYQRTGNSVVGPLPRPPLAGIGTSGGAARPEPAIGVKVAATTAVGTSSTPPLDLSLETRPSNVASAPAGLNVGTRKNTVVGFQQATAPGAQTPYEHGAKDESRGPQAFSDDFDDQPTLIGDSADLQPYLEAERRLEMGTAKPAAPVVPAADTFENAPRIRSSALGLLVPAEVIGTPRTSESDVLSDDDLVPAGSLPPLALPATSPHAVVPSALLESAPEPMMIVPSPAPVPQVQYQAPAPSAIQPSSAYGAAANLPPRPVPQPAQPPAPAPAVQPGQPAFNSTVSGESTLIVRSRFSELEEAAQKPKRPIALYVVGGLVAIGLGTLFALVVTGKLTLPGGTRGTPTTVVTTGAATTGRPTPPPVTNPPTTGSTTTAAATVDSGAAAPAVDAGVAAIVDAGFDAGTVVVAPVEPPVVPPVPVAVPGDLSGITPDSELPESGPRASDMLVDDAMRLMEQGRLDAADVALTRAMERDRINPQGYEAVAKLAIARRDFPAAITAATHATELRPRDSRYFVVLGDAQLGAGDRAAAQASWQRAVSIDRNRDARARLEANP